METLANDCEIAPFHSSAQQVHCMSTICKIWQAVIIKEYIMFTYKTFFFTKSK